jgi:hypothetical protein
MDVRSTVSAPSRGGALTRGILTGLAPVALLAAVGALAVLATTLARTVTAGEPFLTQQPLLVSTFGIGLFVAFGAWIAGCVWALGRARTWGRTGAPLAAAATFWALSASALVTVLPVLLAVLIPQHPAHPAP